MAWFFVAIATIAAVELFLRLPFMEVIGKAIDCARKAIKTIFSKGVSDHWKEKVVLAYAIRIFAASMKTMFLLFGALSPIYVLFFLERTTPVPAYTLILTPAGIAFSFAVSIIYVFVRRRVFGRV